MPRTVPIEKVTTGTIRDTEDGNDWGRTDDCAQHLRDAIAATTVPTHQFDCGGRRHMVNRPTIDWSGLPHFAAHLGFFAKTTRLPQIEVLPVTRCTVRHMLPVLILLDILEPR